MVEYNIDNNTIIKSFSLQLASVGLDGTDFAQLESPLAVCWEHWSIY